VKTYPLKAFYNGKALPDYRAVVKDGLLRIEQPIREGWFPTGGGWYVTTLLERPADMLYIDAGQNWGVTGMLPILHELAADLGLAICCNSTHKVGAHCRYCKTEEN
jgi:hypothetical protein